MKSRLLIATALVLGTASYAFAQADADEMMNYGPKRYQPAAAAAPTPMVNMPAPQIDQTGEQYIYYGPQQQQR